MAVNGARNSIDTTLTAKQGATLMGSYGFASTGEVFTGTAPLALTGQRGQPAEAVTAAILARLHRP